MGMKDVEDCGVLKVTLLTATFNRARLLPRLYESILAQDAPAGSFEWLVIDDGSTDETAGYLADLASRHPDWLRYVTTPNGGKHRALNRGAKLATGDWAMELDSDDWLLAGALAHARQLIDRFHRDRRIGSIIGPRRFARQKDQPVFRLVRNPCTRAELVRYERAFDTCTLRRVASMLAAPFPEIEGELFMAEGWQHFRVSRGSLCWLHNTPLVEAEYLPGGLSANSLRNRQASPVSATLVYEEMLHHDLPPILRLRTLVNQGRFWWHARRHRGSLAAFPGFLFAVLAAPIFLLDAFRAEFRDSSDARP